MIWTMMVRFLGAFGAVISLGLLLEVPKKYLLHAGTAGGIGWLVYQIVKLETESAPLAAFAASLMGACMSHIFARRLKAPVAVFLIAGILPLVPGASIYRSVYYMIRDMRTLSDRYLIQTLQVAGAIALAIFFIDSLFRLGQVRGKRS